MTTKKAAIKKTASKKLSTKTTSKQSKPIARSHPTKLSAKLVNDLNQVLQNHGLPHTMHSITLVATEIPGSAHCYPVGDTWVCDPPTDEPVDN